MGVQITSYDQKGFIKRPQDTETNYYIMSLVMTFTSNDIHDIYDRDQISKQDHDNHQKLSGTMYVFCSISIRQHHLDQQHVYVHH